MKLRAALPFIVFCSLAATWAVAQTKTPSQAAAAQFAGDIPEANQLQLGVGATATYDDNAFNSVPGNGQALFGATPKISWNISHAHWFSLLSYSALVQRSTRYDFYSRTSHNFDTQFNYRFSKSLSLNVTDNFLHSADPLYNAGATGGTQPGSPNSSFVGQPTVRTSNYLDVEGDYRLDARSTVGVGGSYGFQRYSDVPNASFRDSNSASGRASYNYALSQRTRLGASYDYVSITTPAGYDTVSQRMSLTADLTFRPDMSVQVFAGPNHVNSSYHLVQPGGVTIPTSNASWTWSAGGTYIWTATKFSMQGSAIHQVSDGGGLVGAVQLTSFTYGLEGKLPHKFKGSLHVGYNLNDRVNLQANGVSKGQYASAGASLSRQLARDLELRAQYDRMEQLLGSTSGAPWIDRNRVMISITYTFTHPLGR